jgi:hypothetical protein
MTLAGTRQTIRSGSEHQFSGTIIFYVDGYFFFDGSRCHQLYLVWQTKRF